MKAVRELGSERRRILRPCEVIYMTKSTHNGEAQRVGHLWGIPWEVGCYLPSINFLSLLTLFVFIFFFMNFQIITKKQYSIVIGLLLYDGYLYKAGRLQVEQGVKNEDYLKWLYSELQSLSGKLSENVERIHPKTGTPSLSRRFYTQKYLTDFTVLFYEKKKKYERKLFQIKESNF